MQHRARSSTRDDFDKVKIALTKLKTENRRLRKENSQLRKELHRAADFEFDKKVDEEDAEAGPMEVDVEDKRERASDKEPECPKCHSGDFAEIRAGKFLIKACRACGYRKRISAT